MGNKKTSLEAGVLGRYAGDANPVLPEEVHTIGKNAFRRAEIDSCTCCAPQLSIGASAFARSGVKNVRLLGRGCDIEAKAFESCEALETVVFSGQELKIGSSAFRGCTAMTDISFAEKAQAIGSYAFDSCTGLTRAALGPELDTLPEGLFANCEGLRSVSLSRAYPCFPDWIFSGCRALTEIPWTAEIGRAHV